MLSSASEDGLPACISFARQRFRISFAAGSPSEIRTKSNMLELTRAFSETESCYAQVLRSQGQEEETYLQNQT